MQEVWASHSVIGGLRVGISAPPGVRSRRVRSIAFQYGRLEDLARALEEGDFELDVPPGVAVADGEWVLVLFEIVAGGYKTAAAAKAILREGRTSFRFAERDWQRLEMLVCACKSSAKLLPRKSPPDARERTSTSSCPPSAALLPDRVSGIGARVLVVDGEPLVRDMIGTMLEGVGLVVETFADAEEALQRLQHRRFDLLVVDCQLPGMSGIDLCRAIRCGSKHRALPVLFLSSSSSSRDMCEAFAAGADDYMMKPFRAPELGARVLGLLRRATSISLTG